MSSVQTQPQQQPAQFYPTNNIVANQQPHESNGSFGTVFIVLAVILVISVLACVLGRLCNKRFSNRHSHSHSHDPRHHHVKPNRQQIHNIHPREVEGEEDIEYGVDKRIPPPIIARPNPNNNGHHVSHGGVEGTAGPHRHHPPPMMKGFEIKHGPHQEHLREVA